jgi:hypothetical protein
MHLTVNHPSAAGRSTTSAAAESTAENYSSRSDPERALPTSSNLLTSAKTFNDRPATISQREGQTPEFPLV